MKDCVKKDKDKFISIIVPVYNARNTLSRCLDSILQQTYTQWECILVNDGSTDESEKILEAYAGKDERIRVIHQENQGVSTARNEGIRNATGEYVLFIDSDDYVLETYLEKILQELFRESETAFVWTSINIVSSSGRQMKYCSVPEHTKKLSRKDVYKLSKYGLLNSPYCKLYKRSILQENRILFPCNIHIAEDLLFNLQYLDAIQDQPIVVLEDVAYQYVRYEGSLDNRYIPDYWELHQKILAQLKRKAEEWEVPKEDMFFYYERYWDYVQHALNNTMSEQNKKTDKEKRTFNDQILKQEEVKQCIRVMKGKIRRREYFFYRYLNYTCYDLMKKNLRKR